jgi:hypothetical protein
MTLIEVAATIYTIAGGIYIEELYSLAVTTQGAPHLATSIEVGIGIDGNTYNVLAIQNTIHGTDLPRRRHIAHRSQILLEDRRRTMCSGIIILWIEHSHTGGCKVTLLRSS